MSRHKRPLLVPATLVLAGLAFGLTACGDDSNTAGDRGDVTVVECAEPFPEARCEANRAAGTITYLSGFDFAAAASIVDVFVAERAGYFDELCLDVEIQPSFSTDNYPLVAANDGAVLVGRIVQRDRQRSPQANEAEFVALAVEGRTAIDGLIVKPGEAATLEDLAGHDRCQGQAAASVAAMLAAAGLVEGTDYDDGAARRVRPDRAHRDRGDRRLPRLQEQRAGPARPGRHRRTRCSTRPTRASRHVRRDLHEPTFLDRAPDGGPGLRARRDAGLADAIADPAAASDDRGRADRRQRQPELPVAGGRDVPLGDRVELIVDTTPDGSDVGVPDPALLQDEIDTYAGVGLFGDGATPKAGDSIDASVIAAVYADDGSIIFPSVTTDERSASIIRRSSGRGRARRRA